MKRCDNILNNEYYRRCIDRTGEYEKDRIYCLHDMTHALDVARIAYIRALETNSGIKKDVIYAAALVHDAGRCMQYENGTPHNEAAAAIAERVLPECGYSVGEVKEIADAVMAHRDGEAGTELAGVLKFADDMSRMCLWCKAKATCKWDEEDMNVTLEY
ncbi:MAG: HD domain-containing protein [Firmicutes bacterium]|nr:HD domain-containing protein [Bacillota bacterium]